MKIRPVFYAFIALSMITVFSCATGNVSSGSGGEADAPPQKAGAPVKEQAPASKKNAGPLYSGNGGKGTSIAVLTPSGKGLSPDENYLPTLVQGVLAGDFTRYSAMQVIDRQTLDAMIRELLDPVYTEDAEVARLGGIVPAQYILVGELTRAGSSYILNLRIADSKTGAARYSYEGIAARAALDDFSAIRQASEDLLSQMGITLTDTGKKALYGANRRTVEAETALARGVTAQRGGGTVAALNYYSEAADLQTGLTEAEQRLAALTKKIEGGDVGENIRNDIKRRNAWIKLLDEAAAFYQENPYYDLVYYTKPEIGNIDYNRNTAEVKFSFWLEPNARYTAVLKIVRALMKTEKAGEGEEGVAMCTLP